MQNALNRPRMALTVISMISTLPLIIPYHARVCRSSREPYSPSICLLNPLTNPENGHAVAAKANGPTKVLGTEPGNSR